jgi:hypothetical protein
LCSREVAPEHLVQARREVVITVDRALARLQDLPGKPGPRALGNGRGSGGRGHGAAPCDQGTGCGEGDRSLDETTTAQSVFNDLDGRFVHDETV